MRLGLWGARGDRRGLAIQAGEFARHMRPEKVMAFDLRGVRDSRRSLDWSDYQHCDFTLTKYPKVTKQQAQAWMQGLDVVWGCETFYQDEFPAWAAEIGVATIQHCNSEFYRFDQWPRLPRPTLELVPARWRMDQMSGNPEVLPCPLALDRLHYKPRGGPQPTFLHVVGVKASEDRNGTEALLHALKYVTEPCRVLIRSQCNMGLESRQIHKVALEVQQADLPHYWSLYDEGDSVILPRRYGGQCLPMLEAMACGLPVAMTDCEPNHELLDHDWLIPYRSTGQLTTQSGPVTMYHPDPKGIAQIMSRACRDLDWVRRTSKRVRQQAEELGWDRWKGIYQAKLQEAVEKQHGMARAS